MEGAQSATNLSGSIEAPARIGTITAYCCQLVFLKVVHAGVFVGNLPTRLTDLQLLHEVKCAFRRYGEFEIMVNCTNVAKGHERPACPARTVTQ
jgi:hypothetical protein